MSSETSETLTELLIAEYAKRPPLYIQRLSLVRGSRRIKKELEWEVYHALKGEMPIEDIPKKWAYLKAEYKKQKSIFHKYVQKGCSYEEAAELSGKTLWVHFNDLRFLDDHIIDKKQVVEVKKSPLKSNKESVSDCAPLQIETAESTNHSYEEPVLIMKKSPSSECESDYSSAISMSGTCNNRSIENTSLQEETLDSTDHFCKMLSLEMKKLNPRQKAKLQIKYLELLQNVLYEEDD